MAMGYRPGLGLMPGGQVQLSWALALWRSAILLLHSNATSVGILIRNWLERATNVIVVAFTFAFMAMERRLRMRRSVRKLWHVGTLA